MRQAKCKFKVGDRVQSHYGSKWHGIVVEFKQVRTIKNRPDFCCWVVPVLDIWGRSQPKLALRCLNQSWLEKSDREFDKPEGFDDFVASHSKKINGED
jgi:hypothetical protein